MIIMLNLDLFLNRLKFGQTKKRKFKVRDEFHANKKGRLFV